MVLRVRGKVFGRATRGMPCGSKKYGLPANQDGQAKCNIKPVQALKQLGAETARLAGAAPAYRLPT